MKFAAFATLALMTMTAPAMAFDIGAMSDKERAAFGDEVRSYLLANPEVLNEVIEELNHRQATAEAVEDSKLVKANEAALFSDSTSYVGGNLNGDVTVVEFIDYQCGYCRKAHAEVAELVRSDGRIRYVVKEFPILSQDSVTAARFAIAALQTAGPEVYARINDGFYESFRGEVTPDTLTAFAKEMGVDPAPILARMDAPEVTAVITANHQLATALQISGTPTFVMGDTMLRGYLPLESMRKVVAEVRG